MYTLVWTSHMQESKIIFNNVIKKISSCSRQFKCDNIIYLISKFEVRTTDVSYGLSFFSWDLCMYGPSAKVINPIGKKQSSVTYSTKQNTRYVYHYLWV